jgi:tetratricopeptide (TPR) repeat protein
LAKGRVSAQKLKRDPLMEQYVNTSAWVKDRSRPITKWLTVAAAVIALASIGWLFMSRRAAGAAESLAEAFRYHEAIVSNPIPAAVTGYAFATQDEKDRKAYEAFERAARDYPSYNGDVARYFAATHQISFDPEKAEATLKVLSQKNSEVGAQARLALAQRYEAKGKFDDAMAEYQNLKSRPGNVPLQLIDVNMARVYESMGKTKEAVDLYFGIASNKDWRNTELGNTSVERLTVLAPEKADQLPPPASPGPMGGFGGLGGMPIR